MRRSVKKKLRPFLCGLAVLVCAVAGWVYLQWQETQALFFQGVAVSASPSPSTDGTDGKDALDETLPPEDSSGEEGSDELVPPSLDVEDGTSSALGQGEESVDTQVDIPLTEPSVAPSPDLPPTESSQPAVSPSPSEETAEQAVVNQAVAQLYVYQTEFLTALEELYNRAKEEYYALPPEDRTADMRDSMMLGYALEGSILESNCDSLVLDILVDLGSDLKALGASTDIVDEIKASYVAEKTLKKEEYLSILESG